MKVKINLPYVYLLLCALLFSDVLHAQNTTQALASTSTKQPTQAIQDGEDDPVENVTVARSYLDKRMASLEKATDITHTLQQKLLKKLQKKEDKLLKKLAAKDSTAYKQYRAQHPGMSYDSIAKIAGDSTKRFPPSLSNNRLMDSLKGLQGYIQSESGKLTGAASNATSVLSQAGITLPGTSGFTSLQQKLNSQAGVDQLMQQHTADLEKLAGANNIPGVQGIQKEMYYAKAKMKAYKDMADDPDATEQKALEYLQGTDGFEKYINNNQNGNGGVGGNASAADLQRMGYQTIGQVNDLLQQKLGGNTDNVQSQMSQQIQNFTSNLGGIGAKINTIQTDVNQAKSDIAQAKSTEAQAKSSLSTAESSVKNIQEPSFKPNPEKGKPFWKRVEKHYNFQTLQASTDGLRPAMLVLGVALGYKQTKNLTYDVGFGWNTGLGRDWQHLKLTYEGVSLRADIDYKFMYGFSFQLGYERDFIPAGRAYLTDTTIQAINSIPGGTGTTTTTASTQQTDGNVFKSAFGGQQQSAYFGIMKRYKVSSQWYGTLLIGYNFLWQQQSAASPWILRFGWQSSN